MMKREILSTASVRAGILMLMGLIGSLSLVFAGAVITGFKGEPGFNKVTLKWFTEVENNLKGFDIERGLSDQQFEKIGSVEAKGGANEKKEYVYEDNTVFKTTGRIYYYRLKIVDKDGSPPTHSQVITVAPTISSARQTWGSIKAMFR
ncbi:hypothetical protein L0337_09455 [candidate division KSB1 bacterium]|nr:hypothetical protein [candidate division KSB1 bacterium]